MGIGFPFLMVLGPASLGLSPVVPRWLLQLQPSSMHSRQEEEERSSVSRTYVLLSEE